MKLFANTVLKNSFIYILGTVLSAILGYLFHVFISRKLSVADYGELQSLIGISTLLGFGATTLNYFIIKYSSVFAKSNDFIANFNFTKDITVKIQKVLIVFTVIFLLSSPFIKSYLHLSDYWGLIGIGTGVYFSTMGIIFITILKTNR